MPAQDDFPVVFEELKKILKPYASRLTVTADTSNAYSLDGPYSEKWKKVVYFGGAQVKKNYVSFYLMPVYMYPELLKDISPDLKKRMQGKSCFTLRRWNRSFSRNWKHWHIKAPRNLRRRTSDERTRCFF